MNRILDKYKNEVFKILNMGINTLNLARSLKTISSELQVLAYNGVVLSSKINTNQGKSLITLSRFLSDLPSQIGPELLELEKRASVLADELTQSALNIKKLIQFSITLDKLLNRINIESIRIDDINFFDKNEINDILVKKEDTDANETYKHAVEVLISKNAEILEKLSDHFFEARDAFNKTSNTAEKIKRNTFIADYMGSNILIESAYLDTNQKNFSGFVDDINRIISKLNSQLADINNRINFGSQKLKQLNITY